MSPKARPEPADVALPPDTAQKFLATLTPEQEALLRARFGIADPAPEGAGESAPEEVGQDFEVTRARIAEIERKALEKLRGRE